jgi:hypothetical protein
MLAEGSTAVNESVLVDYRNLYSRLRTTGTSANDGFRELMGLNARAGRPVPDEAVLDVLMQVDNDLRAQKATAAGEKCSIDTQDTQIPRIPKEPQGNPRIPSESQRRVGVGAAGPAEEETSRQSKPARQTRRQAADSFIQTFDAELAAGVPSTLRFQEYAYCAVAEEQLHGAPEWQAGYYFLRLLKAHPSLAGASGKQAFGKADRLIRGWREDGWEHFLGVGREDAEAMFVDSWDGVRFLPGRTPLQNALEMSGREPLGLLPEVKERRTDGYERFISLAGWLQVGNGDCPILLPCREVADLFGVKHTTIKRYRDWAKKDGYLVELKEARYTGKRGEGASTEFRFDVSRFECLKQRAQ